MSHPSTKWSDSPQPTAHTGSQTQHTDTAQSPEPTAHSTQAQRANGITDTDAAHRCSTQHTAQRANGITDHASNTWEIVESEIVGK